MIIEKIKTTQFYKFENLSKFSNIKHFVTTRIGGVSSGNYSSLNLSYESQDNSEKVLQNRLIMADAIGIPLTDFVMQDQMQTNHIFIADESHKGSGIYSQSTCIPDNDGLITDKKNVCLFAFAADCVTMLFFDSHKNIIAATHAGWLGTVRKAAKATVETMIHKMGSNPKDIIVGIGPSICQACYEVGENVCEAVENAFGTKEKFLHLNSKTGKYHFDLWFANQQQLTETGIPAENIEISGLCTLCNQDTFYSARSSKEMTGRFGAGIILL